MERIAPGTFLERGEKCSRVGRAFLFFKSIPPGSLRAMTGEKKRREGGRRRKRLEANKEEHVQLITSCTPFRRSYEEEGGGKRG